MGKGKTANGWSEAMRGCLGRASFGDGTSRRIADFAITILSWQRRQSWMTTQ